MLRYYSSYLSWEKVFQKSLRLVRTLKSIREGDGVECLTSRCGTPRRLEYWERTPDPRRWVYKVMFPKGTSWTNTLKYCSRSPRPLCHWVNNERLIFHKLPIDPCLGACVLYFIDLKVKSISGKNRSRICIMNNRKEHYSNEIIQGNALK